MEAAGLEEAALIDSLTNGTGHPECIDVRAASHAPYRKPLLASDGCTRSSQALAVLWCAQVPVVNRNGGEEPTSTCSSYHRPLSLSLEDCLRFCPAIERGCTAAPPALAHCEELCRQTHPSTYCEVLMISGLPRAWPAEVDDLNTRYRLLVP